MTPELYPAPHVHSWGHPACTPKLQLHTQPAHSHHLATSQSEACAQVAQSNPRWTTGKRLADLVSGPGVTRTGNARVSVPVQGLEVEAQVSDRHNSWPFRSSPHGESRGESH